LALVCVAADRERLVARGSEAFRYELGLEDSEFVKFGY